jgi:type III restriction enzyme
LDSANYPVPGNKYFYPVVTDLEDGGEEWRCALAIDDHAQVRHWVRNLDSEPEAAFWLPTSFSRFYPDFVAELVDGRMLVAEYKGEHLRDMPREIEKAEVGRLWATRSAGRCVFAMLFMQEQGLNLSQQIDRALISSA